MRRHARLEPEPVEGPSDRELIDRVRSGDTEAFDPLYRRHARSALLHARHFTRTEAGAQDLRAESFTRVLAAIRGGNGPTEAMRPYLLTTMRHVARDWAESERRTTLVPDPADLEAPAEGADPVIAALERSLAGQAFAALPERWQTVLWHTEVEGEGPAQLAPMLGMEAPAVAALAYRAREGLKQAYLQAHIRELGSEACRPYAGRLGVLVRGRLGTREDAKVNRHVRECAECAGLLAMLKYVNSHLSILIGPAVVGTAYAAKVIVASAAGGAAAGGSGGASHSGGVVARSLSKARHASPRQQAAAALTVAAVAIAAVAFALTGSQVAAPSTAPSPKRQPPSAEPTSAAPASPAPPASSPPPPHSAPPSLAPSSPAPPATSPAQPPPPPPSSPSPPESPTPSPSQPLVMCPGLTINIDVLVQIEIELGIILPGAPPILDCNPLPTEF
ncbi:MAG TPA: sigma-70 family RNA polymerase sigma factor [Actinocrinis sp.]|jgi:RNA polymerase sigma factor (sigma-70 family)